MNEKLKFLDGIKGIACLCVAINHFINIFYSSTIAKNYNEVYANIFNEFPVFRLLYNGNFYVMIFLLVSSFLISYLLFKKDNVLYYKKSIIKRGIRIIFPIFVLCTIIFILYKLSAFTYIQQVMEITLSTSKDIECFQNLSLKKLFGTSLKCLFTTQTSFNFVFWMLPILYKGFFINVILSFLVSKLPIRKAVGILTIASLVIFVAVDNTLVLFPIGTMFAYMYKYIKTNNLKFLENKKLRIGIKIFAVIIFIVGLYLGSTPYNNNFEKYYYILRYFPKLTFTITHIIGAIFVVLAVLLLDNIKRFFELRPFKFLGEISFPVYLIHFPLQCTAGAYVFLYAYKITTSYILALLVTIPIYFSLLLFLSFLFKRFVESKIEKINNKITDWLIYEEVHENYIVNNK